MLIIGIAAGLAVGAAGGYLFAKKSEEKPGTPHLDKPCVQRDELGKIFLWDAHVKTGQGIATLTDNETYVKSGEFDANWTVEKIVAIAGYSYDVKSKAS